MQKRRKPTEEEKRIRKRLLDANITMKDVAAWYGHSSANVSTHLIRQNAHYFDKAIEGIKAGTKAEVA